MDGGTWTIGLHGPCHCSALLHRLTRCPSSPFSQLLSEFVPPSGVFPVPHWVRPPFPSSRASDLCCGPFSRSAHITLAGGGRGGGSGGFSWQKLWHEIWTHQPIQTFGALQPGIHNAEALHSTSKYQPLLHSVQATSSHQVGTATPMEDCHPNPLELDSPRRVHRLMYAFHIFRPPSPTVRTASPPRTACPARTFGAPTGTLPFSTFGERSVPSLLSRSHAALADHLCREACISFVQDMSALRLSIIRHHLHTFPCPIFRFSDSMSRIAVHQPHRGRVSFSESKDESKIFGLRGYEGC